MMTQEVIKMNRRICKKRGLLKDSKYNHVKKEVFEALEAKGDELEKKVSGQKTSEDK